MEFRTAPANIRLIAALNTANPAFAKRLDPDMLEIINPELHIGSNGLTNTRAVLRARLTQIPIQHFSGSVYIYYNRLSLQRVLNGCVIPGSANDYEDSHGVVIALKEQYGIPIEPEDILHVVITNPNSLLISAEYDSVGYYSSITLPFAVVL